MSSSSNTRDISTLFRYMCTSLTLFYLVILIPYVSCQYEERVETVVDIQDPVGLAYGVFDGVAGLFISSFALHDIFFYSYAQLNDYSPVRHPTPTKIVFGGQNDINIDGSFAVASFADPSRMDYDLDRGVLYVASRLSMTIREVDFGSQTVSTVSGSSGENLNFALDVAQYSDFPGMDIQLSNSNLFFVTNSKEVFKVIRHDNTYRKTRYNSLDEYLKYKDYSYDSCNIYSIAPDDRNKILYVSVSEGRNVILSVPFDRTNELEPSYITCVTGQQDHIWSGIGSTYPSIISGSKDVTVLGMPMHLQFDETDNLLIWSEGVPVMDGVMLGSLMIRELDLSDSDKTTTNLAGVNAFLHSPIDPSVYMGSTGGYVDGIASEAEFRYPISLVYVRSVLGDGVSSPLLYVADRWNNAIRRVDRDVHTPAPTITFTPTHSPTVSLRPTKQPTRHPSRPPVTYFPTRKPTMSMAPSTRYRPTPLPTEPDPPACVPTARPSHVHAIGRPTKRPTISPTKSIPAEFRYEDHSAFGNMGFGNGGIGGVDIFLATLLGLLLAALIVMCLIMKGRADKRRLRRQKKLVMRLDDDSDDSDDEDDVWDSTSPAGDVRPSPPAGMLGSLHNAVGSATKLISSAIGSGGGPRHDPVPSGSFSDSGSDAGSVYSDANLMGHSTHSSTSTKSKFGISRFFSKKGGSNLDYSSSGSSFLKTGSSGSISSMLQKLKNSKPGSNQPDNDSFTTSVDVAVEAPGGSSARGLMSDFSSHSSAARSQSNANGDRGIQMNDKGLSRGVGSGGSARSATGMAEGSVTRGGSRRSGPDYL